MLLQFSTRAIVKSLIILASLLIFMHVLSLFIISQGENQLSEVLVEKFSLEEEGNFPTYFSSFILFFSAVLFSIIGKARRQERNGSWKYWFGLAFMFVFLSLDEAVQLHEKLDTDLIWSSFDTEGLLAWPWVILYASLSLVIALVYFRFWYSLPIKFRIAFAVAAGVYVFSALGFEMFEALEYTTNGGITTKYIVLTTIEECFEMIAIIFLISTNLNYIVEHLPELNISFSRAKNLNLG